VLDAEYFMLRAHQELKAAIDSPDQRVRLIHLELADAYSSRLSETRALERRSKMAILGEGRGGLRHEEESTLIRF